MLAFIGMVLLVLAVFGVTIGTVDLVVLGLAFVAAHLAFNVPMPGWPRRD